MESSMMAGGSNKYCTANGEAETAEEWQISRQMLRKCDKQCHRVFQYTNFFISIMMLKGSTLFFPYLTRITHPICWAFAKHHDVFFMFALK